MFALVLLAVVSMFCAIYGVYNMNSKYTCGWMPTKGMKSWCLKLMWVPSASVIVLVLSIAIFRGLLGGGGGFM